MRDFFAILKRALKGEAHDYTKGGIPEAVMLLAIPMILELSLESVFAIVDMYFVSDLGQNAIATVGLTEAVITLVYSVAMGISTGAAAVVARRIGEKNPDGAAHAGAQAILIAIAVSILMGIPGILFAEDILRLMSASSEVISEGAGFARIMIGGNAVIMLLFLINGIFRGAGDAAMAMKSLWLASGINIVLCPIMIRLYDLQGAAVATVIGRGAGVTYQCYHLFKGDGVLKLKASHFGLDFAVIRSLVKVASPAALQFVIGSGSWIFITRLIAETGGTAASAGYQIAFRNFVFFILPAWGLSNAAATLVGQNLGAKEFGRAETSVYVTAKYSAVLMIFITLFLTLCAAPIIDVFTRDQVVAAHGIEGLRIIGSGFLFYGLAMVMIQALNGAGDTKTPTRINFVCFWIFQIPFAYLLAKVLNLNAAGAMAAVPAAESVMALLAWYYFRKGSWKQIQI